MMALLELDRMHPPWTVDARGCWICRAGYKEKHGYRMFKLLGRRIRAHRVAFMATKGLIPKGMVVRHTCDNPECINPAHLLLGTRKDNSHDMSVRGRASHWADRPGTPGHRHRQKLTRRQIRAIRRGQGSSYDMAERYHVSAVQVRRIRNGSRCATL
jgi:hypothetical protein